MRISDWSSDVCSSDLDLQATMTAVKAAKTLPLQDGFFSAHLGATDPELADAIRGELRRQQDQTELIASANVVSLAVLEAQGSDGKSDVWGKKGSVGVVLGVHRLDKKQND